MSAFTLYIDHDNVIFATDTMLSERFTLPDKSIKSKYYGFTQKVHFFANYRCCMICMGDHKTSVYLDKFVNSRAGSTDIEDLVVALEKDFYNSIDLQEYIKPAGYEKGEISGSALLIGSIEIFAYSRIENRMVWYYVNISWKTGFKIEKKNYPNGTVLSVPFINDKTAEKEIISNQYGVHQKLVELMKVQYKESLIRSTHAVPIGGEILLTAMAAKPMFSIALGLPYKFDNFENVYAGFRHKEFNDPAVWFKTKD